MKKDFLALAWTVLCAVCAPVLMASGQQDQSGGTDQEEVLFSVGNEPVSRSEFDYVYRKNNPSKQNDYSRSSLEEYLDLYINFKLKVREARALRIDTLPTVQSELDRYRKQLVKSYFDRAVTDGMTASAYDRMMMEIDAHHIMISVQPGAEPEDTLAAYNRIRQIRDRLLKGEDFGALAAMVSEDPSAVENKGNIGYVTGLQIPDASFEDALFNTPKGQISQPVRSRYGYHLVKPGERRSNRGTVSVAHLLVKVPKDADEETRSAALKRATELREQIRGGIPFDSLVMKNSDDKGTAAQGGRLEPFSTGKMVPAFEEAAFALKNPGDVSEPVETSYGYHLIRLIEHNPLPGYEEMKGEIMRRIQRAGRYDEARNQFIRQAQSEFGMKENPSALAQFIANTDSSILINTWRARKATRLQDTLFMLGNTPFMIEDFAAHVERSQRAYRDEDIAAKVNRLYDQYVEDISVEYALGRRDEPFRRLLQEYRDGILLFELTEEKVWQQAMRDSTGLMAFYEQNKQRYLWDERVEAVIYTIEDAKTAKKVRKSLQGGATDEEILSKYNTEDQDPVVRTEFSNYLKGQSAFVDAAGSEIGLAENQSNESGHVVIVQVLELLPKMPKSLDEAKGYVISDYQEHLEKSWVAELRAKYPVQVNSEVLESMIR